MREFTRYQRVSGQAVLTERFADSVAYDLTACRDESLETEEGEEALLQCGHAGEACGGGSLALALTAWVDDQSFSDAA